MKHLLKMLLALVVCLGFGQASRADLVTFDDLSAASGIISNGYAGLNWNNFNFIAGNSPGVTPSGFNNSIVSGTQVGYNGAGAAASISSPMGIVVGSGYFTSVWNDNLAIDAIGLSGNTIVANKVFVVSPLGPTKVDLNFSGIDKLLFIAIGGTQHAGYTGQGTEFAVDNLQVSRLPEPTSLTMLGSAVVLTAAYGWRRRRRAA